MALQKHLKARKDRPQVLDKVRKRLKGEGSLLLSVGTLKAGEVFLAGPKEAVLRLRWTKESKPTRHLLPGKYRVLGYRFVKGEWFVSATGGKWPLEIQAGKTHTLKLHAGATIAFRANKRRDRVSLQFSIRGDKDMGLSLYRKGKRIPLPFELLSGEDEAAAGTLRYG